MTDHVMFPIPNPDAYAKRLGVSFPPRMACVVCGLWDKNTGVGNNDCDKVKKVMGMVHYQAGGVSDPFAGMRINGKVIGAPYPTQAQQALGTLGVGAHGMPIRDPAAGEAAGGTYSPPKPAETRPGLAPETIDKKAYDEFGKMFR